jgi:GTP pyrophosphokinase
LHIIEKENTEAIGFAKKAHKGQKRKDGAEYISHPLSVAQMVLKAADELKLSKKEKKILFQSALFHDVVEDTKIKLKEIEEMFGPKVANFVSELTTIQKKLKKHPAGKAGYLSDKMNAMTSQALLLKLADRLHNIIHMKNAGKKFAKNYIKQTKIIMLGGEVNGKKVKGIKERIEKETKSHKKLYKKIIQVLENHN